MTCDTKQTFFEDRVFLVPKGKGGTDILMGVAVSGKAVFALASQIQ